MGLSARIVLLAKGKVSAALDHAEDPREVLEYGYQQQQRELVNVERSLVEVVAAKMRLAEQARRIRDGIPLYGDQAQRALELGREDLAREALQRKHVALVELEMLETQVAEIGGDEERLAAAQQKLLLRIDEFRCRKGILSARYSSARARVRAGEALTGISGELAELNLALGRAEEKTEQLQARAGALDALIESNALAPAWGSSDPFAQELRRLGSAYSAEAELEELKRQLDSGPQPLALGDGS